MSDIEHQRATVTTFTNKESEMESKSGKERERKGGGETHRDGDGKLYYRCLYLRVSGFPHSYPS